jgi:hypothetical protein
MGRLASDLGISEDDVYPADYFDLMGGVGFGGYACYSSSYTKISSSIFQTCSLHTWASSHER